MLEIAALYAATSAAGTLVMARWMRGLAQLYADSLDHTNNQASNSHRAHEAVVVPARDAEIIPFPTLVHSGGIAA